GPQAAGTRSKNAVDRSTSAGKVSTGTRAAVTRSMIFTTGPAPHVVAPSSVGRVMRIVIYALLPTIALHVVFFGPGLIVQIALAIATALAAEAMALRLRRL